MFVGIAYSERECPICKNNSIIRITSGGSIGVTGSHPTGPDVYVECKTCGYEIQFNAVAFYPFIGLIFGSIPVALIGFALNLPGIVVLLMVVLTILALLLFPFWFIHSPRFDGYINKIIRKKTIRLLKRGITLDRWWGDKFENHQNLKVYELEDPALEY